MDTAHSNHNSSFNNKDLLLLFHVPAWKHAALFRESFDFKVEIILHCFPSFHSSTMINSMTKATLTGKCLSRLAAYSLS